MPHWLLPQVGILLLWSPWAMPAVRQTIGVYRRFWIPFPTFETAINALGSFLSDLLPLRRWPADRWSSMTTGSKCGVSLMWRMLYGRCWR